jgi:hypothetical protein
MHAVIRRYTDATKLIDVMERKPHEVDREISTVPGFVAYHAIKSGDTLVTISVCQDQTGTEETTRRAANWVRANLEPGAVGAPDVTRGEVFINLGAAHTVSA